jgi:hypothetical protein
MTRSTIHLFPPLLLIALIAACSARMEGSRPRSSPELEPPIAAIDAIEPIVIGPAAVPLPPTPPLERTGSPMAPSPAELQRDAALCDRFTTEGQSVEYSFQSNDGELSIFDLMTWGYARGWHSTAHVRILDERDHVLVDERPSGGTAWRDFVCFTAPARGTYRYELRSESECFRYRVIRYAGYRGREQWDVEPIGASNIAHGYVRSSDDRAQYSIHLAEDEEVAIKVLNSEEAGRCERRKTVPPPPGGPIVGYLYPSFQLAIDLDGVPQSDPNHYMLFRAPHEGLYRIIVSTVESSMGGLFDLEIDRRVEKISVRGSVRDSEDLAIAGVELAFYLGPDRDCTGTTMTNRAGTFELELPPGDYRVEMSRASGARAHEIETTIKRSRELNLVWIEPRSSSERIGMGAAVR